MLFWFQMIMELHGHLKSTDYVFEDLTYGNGKFIGVQFKQSQSGYGWTYERIYSSTDGENWTLVHDPNY